MVFTAMKSAITKKSNENTLVRGKSVNLKPQLGTAIACLLHAKAPKKASFIQSMLSIQLWRGGLTRDSIKQFARTGICKGYNATLKYVDQIRLDFDSAAIKCKEQIQEQLGNVQNRYFVGDAERNDVSIAIAATVPNVEDAINDPSSNDDTIPLVYNMDDAIPYGIEDTDDDDEGELNQHEQDIATAEMEVISEDDEESEESDSTMEVNQDLPDLEEVESGNVGDNSDEEILEPT